MSEYFSSYLREQRRPGFSKDCLKFSTKSSNGRELVSKRDSLRLVGARATTSIERSDVPC